MSTEEQTEEQIVAEALSYLNKLRSQKAPFSEVKAYIEKQFPYKNPNGKSWLDWPDAISEWQQRYYPQ